MHHCCLFPEGTLIGSCIWPERLYLAIFSLLIFPFLHCFYLLFPEKSLFSVVSPHCDIKWHEYWGMTSLGPYSFFCNQAVWLTSKNKVNINKYQLVYRVMAGWRTVPLLFSFYLAALLLTFTPISLQGHTLSRRQRLLLAMLTI